MFDAPEPLSVWIYGLKCCILGFFDAEITPWGAGAPLMRAHMIVTNFAQMEVSIRYELTQGATPSMPLTRMPP